jgi:lipopolysaccharide/colanic/teichoic acid biosynthesis glycosyltransferase
MMPKPQRIGRSSGTKSHFDLVPENSAIPQLLPQETFLRMLYIEQRRTERSQTPFVLMLLEPKVAWSRLAPRIFDRVLVALSESTRETDISGWYAQGSVIGVIYTEIGTTDPKSASSTLLGKVAESLSNHLGAEESKGFSLSVYVFPDEQTAGVDGLNTKPVLCPDFGGKPSKNDIIKRGMDIGGSLFALILASPLLLVIAAIVKLTSKGPVLFRQERVGRYGRNFTFLKFRSMYAGNDPRIHEEFVKRLIVADKDSAQNKSEAPAMRKMTSDPRVTPIGRFLRKTSLDEVPQFINVLLGDMSLVGPRPPIPYEVKCYELWHRRRVLSVKPGITGLWQVLGRSRVSFDNMVRMDLRYAMSWTPWLDVKILLKTPRAVLSGEGAF